MEPTVLAGHLASLMHLDVDASNIYGEALEHVTDADVRGHFEQFKAEHEYHATVLGAEIRALGEEPPEPREDFAGELAEIVTAIRSARGTEGAIHAMRTAERYHNRRYGDAQGWEAGTKARGVLARFFEDERRHLEYCERKSAALAHQP